MNTNAIRMGRRPWPPVIDEPTETPVNAAQFVGQSIPASMVAGQPYDVTVTMRNTGSTMWTPQASYRLGSVAANWGLDRVELPAPIAPGEDAAFRLRVTAPAIAGAHAFRWRMLQGTAGWFGDQTPDVVIEVRPPLVAPTASLNDAVDSCGRLPAVVETNDPLGPQTTRTLPVNEVSYHVTEQRFHQVADTASHAFLQDLAALGVWPGQVIQGRGLLAGDVASVGPFKRMPGTINIATDLIGGTPGPQSSIIEAPTAAAVDDARRRMLQAIDPNDAAGLLQAKFTRANTYREAGLKLGISVKGSAFNVDANASLDESLRTTTVVATIRQVFYSVTFTPHAARAGGIWSEADLRKEDLAPYVAPGNPPLIVDSVQYGRFICVAAQGAYSSQELSAALSAHLDASISVDVETDARLKQILDTSEVTIYTNGVPGRGSFQTLEDPANQLEQVYKDGLAFSVHNPGAPISFTCRHIADGTLAHVGLAADYVRPLGIKGQGVTAKPCEVWDGPGGGLVNTGISVNPGDLVTIRAGGEIWSGVWLAGRHGVQGWPGHKADPAAPMPSGTAYCLIGRFGNGPWFEVGALWQSTPPAGSQGLLQFNVNDNNVYNGDPNARWAISVDVTRADAGAFGLYL